MKWTGFSLSSNLFSISCKWQPYSFVLLIKTLDSSSDFPFISYFTFTPARNSFYSACKISLEYQSCLSLPQLAFMAQSNIIYQLGYSSNSWLVSFPLPWDPSVHSSHSCQSDPAKTQLSQVTFLLSYCFFPFLPWYLHGHFSQFL